MKAFPALGLAYEAGRIGGGMPTVFNASNEWAVARFLGHRLGFNDITRTIERCMAEIKVTESPSLDEILELEREVYARLENNN